jgi:methylenetetrahydrofolate dehydrogenase (NAD+)
MVQSTHILSRLFDPSIMSFQLNSTILRLAKIRRRNCVRPGGFVILGDILYGNNNRWPHQMRFAAGFASNDHAANNEPEYLALVTHTAEKMRQSVRDYIANYSRTSMVGMQHGFREFDDLTTCISTPPKIKLVGILATTVAHNSCDDDTDTHGNERYSEQISAICTADGITYEPWRVPPTRDALERSIQHANERLDVHGILVFYPVSSKLTDVQDDGQKYRRGPSKCDATGVYYKSLDDYFRDLVSPEKDVEGYHRKALRVKDSECREDEEECMSSCSSKVQSDIKPDAIEGRYGPIYPCTALAVFRILESFFTENNSIILSDSDTNWINKKCFIFANTTMTIINRSEVLGLPLATMLANNAATIYSVDKDSILKFQPDGKIRREHSSTTVEECVRKSTVIVSGVPSDDFIIPTDWIQDNAIVINVANSSNFEEETLLIEKPGITYVPHVGRVTVAALESNLICLHKNYHL